MLVAATITSEKSIQLKGAPMPMAQYSIRVQRVVFAWALLASAVMGVGCGQAEDPLNRVSGQVTYQGNPVPVGVIQFSPDSAAGNNGAAGFAEIRDGAYDTTVNGRGVEAGSMIVTIDAYSMQNVNPDLLPNGEALIIGYQQKVKVGNDPETKLDFEITKKKR